MKIADIQTVPQQWPAILDWLHAGEEVELRQGEDAVARMTPLPPRKTEGSVEWPDFVARARKIWGGERASLADALIEERNERA